MYMFVKCVLGDKPCLNLQLGQWLWPVVLAVAKVTLIWTQPYFDEPNRMCFLPCLCSNLEELRQQFNEVFEAFTRDKENEVWLRIHHAHITHLTVSFFNSFLKMKNSNK